MREIARLKSVSSWYKGRPWTAQRGGNPKALFLRYFIEGAIQAQAHNVGFEQAAGSGIGLLTVCLKYFED